MNMNDIDRLFEEYDVRKSEWDRQFVRVLGRIVTRRV